MRATSIILSVSVLLASGSAQGAWQKLNKIIAVDPATLKRSGSLARVVWLWEMDGYGTRVGNVAVRSSIQEAEYDCRKERVRTLRFTAYAQPGGQGPEIKFDNNKQALYMTNWIPTEDDPVFDFACGVKKASQKPAASAAPVASASGKLPFTGTRSFCEGQYKAIIAIRNDRFTMVKTNMWTDRGKVVTFSGKLDDRGILRRNRDIYLEIKSAKEIRMMAPQDYMTGKPCR